MPGRNVFDSKGKKMSKLKSKSSAKKRFRFSATGKVISPQAGKQHGMRKRSNDRIREARGTMILSKAETSRVRRYLPYA